MNLNNRIPCQPLCYAHLTDVVMFWVDSRLMLWQRPADALNQLSNLILKRPSTVEPDHVMMMMLMIIVLLRLALLIPPLLLLLLMVLVLYRCLWQRMSEDILHFQSRQTDAPKMALFEHPKIRPTVRSCIAVGLWVVSPFSTRPTHNELKRLDRLHIFTSHTREKNK